ncbi:MAG: hypothetical protein COX02_02425 [Candidatus Vogelbacteria bacterium CG22_combo_CG10-13_8_21_14_all_37_9]|uniref:Bacterial Ig domain-containing protein n=1 Tax=Candidatus Vogelbacteria bacterium CG22_combo_CG10-13_8_21_14_all_37_9 TaxID=1975046 RepID=A0A2H0BLZ5_9BACT|nr:MAG: hypothetical protein COX02_02425 [Candidatus Vogelbacteria bacterium CG22_combo_CG10-13_8_21_14_all_37_9]
MIARELSRQTYFKMIALALLFLIIIIYAGFKTHNILLGPEIKITYPENGSTILSPLVTINGQAKRIAKIYFNNRKIFTDDNGVFKESLLLARGYNILEFTAEDGFGREITKKVELVLQ